MREGLPRPRPANDLEALLAHRADVVGIEAMPFEFVGEIAASNSEIEPPARELIDNGIILGHVERIAQRHQGDRRA
jgi:hypothetical protein